MDTQETLARSMRLLEIMDRSRQQKSHQTNNDTIWSLFHFPAARAFIPTALTKQLEDSFCFGIFGHAVRNTASWTLAYAIDTDLRWNYSSSASCLTDDHKSRVPEDGINLVSKENIVKPHLQWKRRLCCSWGLTRVVFAQIDMCQLLHQRNQITRIRLLEWPMLPSRAV